MASADFSQFVVTTANETACEISPVKVRTLSLHVPAAFTRTSSNFWTSVSFATLSVFPSLLCGSCPSGQRFAYSFFQIPPRDGHPCCSAMCFVVAYAHSGLSPVRERPCWANKIGVRIPTGIATPIFKWHPKQLDLLRAQSHDGILLGGASRRNKTG